VRVVVTGAAGFIGSHVVDALLAGGHDVVGVDCFTDAYARSAKEANLAPARQHPRFGFHELDLRVGDLAPVVAGADVVVNEAATPGLDPSWTDFDAYQSCNLTAVHRLIEASAAAGVPRVVQASTSSVYGADATGDESSPTRPVSPYGVTKLAAEHLLLAHHEVHGFPVTILRYFSVYGPRQRPDMAYRIFCERLVRGEPITVYGDGSQVRANTYVDDCVAATLAAIDRGRAGAVYNIGGGRPVALRDAIATLAAVLGVEPVVRHEPARPGDQRRTEAHTTKAAAELGWAPVVEPEDGLAREAAWVAERVRSAT
jgi:nucleoside-diphosphate-sugar epimerase